VPTGTATRGQMGRWFAVGIDEGLQELILYFPVVEIAK
jgi:hypothetical protein